jgi:hypothetical protein
MVDAKRAPMALRTFRAGDGSQWTVWSIRAGSAGVVAGPPAEWLAFQNEDCTERRRLFDIPAGWDELSDERLELLRRVAEPVTLLVPRHSPAGGMVQPEAVSDE